MSDAREALIDTIKDFTIAPNLFVKEALAKDRFGNDVHPADPKAVCFCAVGLMAKKMGIEDGDDAYDFVAEKLYNAPDLGIDSTDDIVIINDSAANAEHAVADLRELL